MERSPDTQVWERDLALLCHSQLCDPRKRPPNPSVAPFENGTRKSAQHMGLNETSLKDALQEPNTEGGQESVVGVVA